MEKYNENIRDLFAMKVSEAKTVGTLLQVIVSIIITTAMANPVHAWTTQYVGNSAQAYTECNAAYAPYPKYTWSSNPTRCQSIAAGGGGNENSEFHVMTFSVLDRISGFTGEPVQHAWHTSCENLESWESSGSNFIWVGCTQYRWYYSAVCPPNYEMNQELRVCEAICKIGATFTLTANGDDEVVGECEETPKERSCSSQVNSTVTDNPIDFSDGAKYRTETVMSAGRIFPIVLKFHYNNFGNAEKTIRGRIPINRTQTYVAHSTPPIRAEELNDYGLKNSLLENPNQHFSHFRRFWRHNYDEALFEEANRISWLRSQGEVVIFDNAGNSSVYPKLKLTTVDASKYGFAGREIILSSGLKKVFDMNGRYRRLVHPSGHYHDIVYNTNNEPTQINHSLYGSISLGHTNYVVASVYGGIAESQAPFVTSVTDQAGRVSEIEWGELFKGRLMHWGITRITKPSTGEPVAARVYEYNDPDWAPSITDIYDVSDIATNTRKLFAHFEYDDLGRAVLSELGGGADRVSIDYLDDDFTRRVTNSLGKSSVYTLADFNGTRRLESVQGEASANCVETNTSFVYTTDGNIDTKTQNGQVTKYDYNTRGLRTRTTEAFGTPLARTIETIWHPDFNLPATIIEPHRTIQFDYHPNGQLRQRQITDTVTP